MAVFNKLSRMSVILLTRTIRPFSSKTASQEQYWKDRVQLAGAYRILDHLGLNEGICNHLTLMSRMPGPEPEGTSVMLVVPYGLLWSEVRASDLLAIDADNNVVEGNGEIETSALMLHREVHNLRADATAVFHAHMPYTTALSALEDPRVIACHQGSARFVKGMAYDFDYGGYIEDGAEGRRIATLLGDKPFMIMQNHGPLITGSTVAVAFDRLYFLERVCMYQMLAYSAGKPLKELSDDVVEKAAKYLFSLEEVYTEQHFQAHLRKLRRTDPEFER